MGKEEIKETDVDGVKSEVIKKNQTEELKTSQLVSGSRTSYGDNEDMTFVS